MNKSEKCSNTQKGRIVIHKDNVEKRIYKEELPMYIQEGWLVGISEQHRNATSTSHKGKEAWNKGLTKENNSSLLSTSEKLSKLYKGTPPWNKGLSLEDDRVRKNIEKSSQTKIEKYGSAFPNNNMNELHKKHISESLKGNTNSPTKDNRDMEKYSRVYQKISDSKKGHSVSEETRKKISKSKKGKKLDKDKLQIFLTKQYITKKLNNSFNKSNSEELLYKNLLKENVNKTILRQYKDSRYPFYCDFYIVEDDLFIELNAHWTHGGKPYNPEDRDCQKQLEEWKEKAKTSQFYQQAIETWTVRDVQKLKCAKDNNLNYKVIY